MKCGTMVRSPQCHTSRSVGGPCHPYSRRPYVARGTCRSRDTRGTCPAFLGQATTLATASSLTIIRRPSTCWASPPAPSHHRQPRDGRLPLLRLRPRHLLGPGGQRHPGAGQPRIPHGRPRRRCTRLYYGHPVQQRHVTNNIIALAQHGRPRPGLATRQRHGAAPHWERELRTKCNTRRGRGGLALHGQKNSPKHKLKNSTRVRRVKVRVCALPLGKTSQPAVPRTLACTLTSSLSMHGLGRFSATPGSEMRLSRATCTAMLLSRRRPTRVPGRLCPRPRPRLRLSVLGGSSRRGWREAKPTGPARLAATEAGHSGNPVARTQPRSSQTHSSSAGRALSHLQTLSCRRNPLP